MRKRDGDFLPDFGDRYRYGTCTQHPPANYLSRYSSLSPIALKIGLKDAALASFEPMCTCDLDLNSNNATNMVHRGNFLRAKILKVDFAQ